MAKEKHIWERPEGGDIEIEEVKMVFVRRDRATGKFKGYAYRKLCEDIVDKLDLDDAIREKLADE